MNGSSAPVVRLQNVAHLYGATIAVDNVSLDIPAGEMVGFIGPDGTGKSTLLGLISGAVKIQKGTIEVLGGNMKTRAHRRSVCPRIAYMPQGLGKNLYPTLSVDENLNFFGRLFGLMARERKEHIEELLASTGLKAFRDRPVGMLSGGMKQKLGICCSLIHDPDLLILDEPTTGVDPLSRRQFWDLIKSIRERRPGMSVIIATAYMEEAEGFDWLIAMNAGRLLTTGSAHELKETTGRTTLEEAFIQLLPEDQRKGHRELVIPPRKPDAEVVIEVRDLTKRFGKFMAVDHVSLSVRRGEIFGFLGSNGCGKSTTMKMLTGLLKASEGQALLFGKPVSAGDLEVRRHVGYMSQAFSLYTELTVRQNLLLHAQLYEVPTAEIDARVKEMTRRFGLESVLDQLPDGLPLGIRQRLTATVVRDDTPREIPLRDLVPGDIINLSAGDMIPGDVRVLSAKDLFVSQGTLTGESLPVEKFHDADPHAANSPVELKNICFMGTSVQSGTATAVVVVTGVRTYLGTMASSITQEETPTSFDQGLSRFTWLMIQLMAVMVPLVFFINGFTKHDWKSAFFFAMAVAVGLTPEMLPMIVSVCLSKGALAMSRKKVIVKRLNAIQNFGGMDVLCTDKTGTLTEDRVVLQRHCNVAGRETDEVLRDGYLISHFQTGLKNLLDTAILNSSDFHEQALIEKYKKLDEIPFDFTRRMMSVLVENPEGKAILLTKGAPEEIFHQCSQFELDGKLSPMDPTRMKGLKDQYASLSEDGFRVLAVAVKELDGKKSCSKEDERDLVLKGYVAFLDPPKPTAATAIQALHKHGVAVKILTGDNDLISRKVCRDVGLLADPMLLGDEVEKMSDEQLAEAAEKTTLFARLSPAHKQRIVRILRTKGHVVGFMGDGINDSPALRAADIGISVDTAADIAKESADLILLQKDLMVLEGGVIEGRKVFANILKYIRMGASSNFGNMFSVLGASAFLPFLPMAPIQILTNNMLYDFSQVPIPNDAVDDELVARPRPWKIEEIKRFILCIGPISSIFDYSTFFVMLYLFKCWDPSRAPLFQTGWFVESIMTQTLVIHIIRTNKIPFFQSRASWPLLITTFTIMAFGAWLPYSPLASSLGLTHLPAMYWPILLLTLLAYTGLTQGVKVWLLRMEWI